MVGISPRLPMKETAVPDALELLKIRRSVKPREMNGPGPSPAELETILTIGARVPDHGKLTPWRFIVFEGDARIRGGEVIAKVFAAKNPQAPAGSGSGSGSGLRLPGGVRIGGGGITVDCPAGMTYQGVMLGCNIGDEF